ncbi:MAG: glycosyltransferase family 2 protein [Lachnospiraceae bacterium]|nr:glycosyltransferase family 2 protein [Lachnospiraceae bacterium]
MKLLTIVVPSYNSQDYLERCIDSLMIGDEDVEVLIVDDGSTDRTGEIADAYEAKYPEIVRAIHKENGGHGSAVNAGLEQARGLYFKVVDSDDWVKYSAYKQILDALRRLTGGEKVLDMLISNFVYEKEGAKRKKVVAFCNALPENTMFTWDEVRHFHKSQNILMHSVIYRTKLLKDCGLKLPEHTFYVDNIFVFEPLPYVRNMYYMDVNFYRYYIGREDQSVNEKVMISRIDQQLKVNKMMVDYYVSTKIPNEKTAKYMLKYLDIITTVSSIMLILADTEEALLKKDELWQYIKEKDKRLFLKMRLGFLGGTMNLPGKGGRKMSEGLYRLARRFVQFN